MALSAQCACLLFTLLTVSACGREAAVQRPSGASFGPSSVKPQSTQAESDQHRKTSSLAYEHSVSIEMDRATLPNRIRELQNACAADQQFGCTLLDISLRNAEDLPSGTVRMRLAPAGVDAFITAAAKSGKVTGRITHAEDLAEAVSDTERQLSLLTTHRDRLSEFVKDRNLKVDQLITVSKELASVQTEIDALTTMRANLRRRIDTELLTIELSVPPATVAAQRTPVSNALTAFGAEFTDAIGDVIRFIAVLIPWLIVIAPSMVFLQMFWRAIGRWLARRERNT